MSATTATLDIPRDVTYATRMSLAELKCELAVHLFEEKKLSLGKASQLAGMTLWDFLPLLAGRGIPLHYDIEDYEEDLATLKEGGRL